MGRRKEIFEETWIWHSKEIWLDLLNGDGMDTLLQLASILWNNKRRIQNQYVTLFMRLLGHDKFCIVLKNNYRRILDLMVQRIINGAISKLQETIHHSFNHRLDWALEIIFIEKKRRLI